tara:strand:+ start:362 stop:499 length:138 start_codon:yes stop_codon:yes gene_type:complete
MRKLQYRIRIKAKEYIFETIQKARDCRQRLKEMGYNNISLIVEEL